MHGGDWPVSGRAAGTASGAAPWAGISAWLLSRGVAGGRRRCGCRAARPAGVEHQTVLVGAGNRVRQRFDGGIAGGLEAMLVGAQGESRW